MEQGKTVYIKAITNEKQFISEWNKMSNNNRTQTIEIVSLYFHSNPETLIIDYTKDEYITINQDGKTSSGAEATRVQDLEKKYIASIYLYACNSAHQDYKENLASTFIKNQNVSYVYGWDGSMRWSYLWGTPCLAYKQNYFESWLIYGKRNPKGLIRYGTTRRGGRTNPKATVIGKWENK